MRCVSINIDLKALQHNYALLAKLAPQAKVFCVLKADAYGHGALACAQALQASDAFAVVMSDEAFTLRAADVIQPLLIFQGPRSVDEVLKAAELDCTLVIHSDHQLNYLSTAALLIKKQLKVWVKIDTGMGRLGFAPETLNKVVLRLNAFSWVSLQGCLSHMPCADDVDDLSNEQQISLFKSSAKGLELPLSLANSAAVLAWPNSHLNWIRPGIMLYGANPLWPKAPPVNLEPVMTVTAPVISIRQRHKGDYIGYGKTYCCEKTMQTACVAIGYGDGFPRHISPGTQVLIRGELCDIVGRVSMDSITIDVSSLSSVCIGDAVTLWGKGVPIERLAKSAETISYELLCQIKGKRFYH
jgi:alanine racemase